MHLRFLFIALFPFAAMADENTADLPFQDLPTELIQAIDNERPELHSALSENSTAATVLRPSLDQDLYLTSYGNTPHCEVFYDVWVKEPSAEAYVLSDGFVSCVKVHLTSKVPLRLEVQDINPVLSRTIYQWAGTGFSIEYVRRTSDDTRELSALSTLDMTLYKIIANATVQERLLQHMDFADVIALGFQTGAEYPAEVTDGYLIAYSCVRVQKCDFTSAAIAISLEDDHIFAVLTKGDHRQIWGDLSALPSAPERLKNYITSGRW